MNQGSPLMVRYPPGPHPPGEVPAEIEVGVAYCIDCGEFIGPALAEDVSQTVVEMHIILGHEVDSKYWREEVDV